MKVRCLIAALVFSLTLQAQERIESALKAIGAPNNPKVQIDWNRFYDNEAVGEILYKLNDAYPAITSLNSIGKSFSGKNIWCLTINNPNTGNEFDKPAFYIDAAVHANEIQAVETVLYSAWFLLESYETNSYIKQLVDRIVFYIIPSQSPDSRDIFLDEANYFHLRAGQIPRDDDGDGLFDEDPYDDLNGDGHISQMRIKSKNGRWKVHPKYTYLMVRADEDEEGEYDLIFGEGIDNDGDGRLNEDGNGYYDPNRNWGFLWKPNYIQYGADHFPFSIEETKIISDFMKAHPNILASQSYHNTGGWLLIGPNQNEEDVVHKEDIELFDYLGGLGEKILPGYEYINTYKDFYPTYGDETNWHYASLGVMPFVNELWTSFNMFRRKIERGERDESSGFFNDILLFGEAFVQWEEYDHPQFGKIEIGGFKKQFGRVPPSFLLEEECHRNFAFTLLHASFLPEIVIDTPIVNQLGGGLYQIRTTVRNKNYIPTRLYVDELNNIGRPDWLIIKNADVISGGLSSSEFDSKFDEQKFNPHKLEVERLEGNSSVTAVWVIRKTDSVEIEYNSLKGGKKKLKLDKIY